MHANRRPTEDSTRSEPLNAAPNDGGVNVITFPLVSFPEGQLLDHYAASMRRRRLAETTIRLRLFYARKMIEWLPVHPYLASIEMLERYAASGDWSNATQQTVIASMKSFYGWAYRAEHTTRNLADDLYNVRPVRKRSRIASDSAILAGLTDAPIPDQAMILLGAECGLRVHEIAKLHRDDRHDEWLDIVGKGGKQRTVFLTPELQDILDEIERTTMRHGNYFPGSHGTPMHPSTVWRHISERCGTNPHSLRHRAGTAVYKASGHDIRLAQEFLGHASPVTTAIYVHVADDALRKAAEHTRISRPAA